MAGPGRRRYIAANRGAILIPAPGALPLAPLARIEKSARARGNWLLYGFAGFG